MGWFRKRGSEPSTYAGFAGVFQGLKMLAPQYAAIFDILTMVTGSVAAIKSDPSKVQ